MRKLGVLAFAFMFGCSSPSPISHGSGGSAGSGGGGAGSGGSGGGIGGNGGSGGTGSGGSGGSTGGVYDAGVTYTIYAHSDTTLYTVDTVNKALNLVGDFNAPQIPVPGKKDMGTENDVIQDLAITPDNTIYVISKTTLYTADPKDGHVTVVGNVGVCGTDNVALTTTPDGKLYSADYGGSFCEIDVTVSPPTVTKLGTLGMNMAISGDIVGLGDGSIYGTAYELGGGKDMSSTDNNTLVKLDPTTGSITKVIGLTGYPKLFGVAFANGVVYGFTHDTTGRVVTIDPKTGIGTLFGTFKDSTGALISFAGAGVNSTVPPPPIS